MDYKHLELNSLIGNRYLITKVLGEGGMGVVYQATDQQLGRTIALKKAIFTDNYLPAHFDSEARLLASLRHIMLPIVIEKLSDEKGHFLVMEFIDGPDLQSLLEQRKQPFPYEEVLDWGEQLLDVLHYLHSRPKPVFHRDIKPLNLKLNADGIVVLLDFGLAKEDAYPSAGNTLLGCTPDYAPLEQFVRAYRPMYEEISDTQLQELLNGHTDARVDIYSLAATMYHLMTGAKPTNPTYRYSAIRAGGPDPLPSANEVRPDVPSRLAVFLRQAMAIMPESRFVSAKEMMKALQEVKSFLKKGSNNKSQLTTLPMADHRANEVKHIPHETKVSEAAQEIYRDEIESVQSESISQLPAFESNRVSKKAETPSQSDHRISWVNQSAPRILWLKPASSFKEDAVGNDDEGVPKIVRITRTPSSPKQRGSTKA